MSEIPPKDANTDDNEPSGTSAPTKEQAILRKLLFDEEEFLNRLEETVARALRFFNIEPQTGRVVLSGEGQRRKVADQVRLMLAGRYFAWRLGVIKADKMSYREIAVELNRPPSGISTEVTDLVRDGDVVRDDDGLLSMPFHRVDGILREMEQAAPVATEPATNGASARRASARRAPRTKADTVLQGMFEKGADLSAYPWVRDLQTARDKGLAALLIAKEAFSVEDLTCLQMATFLTHSFPVKVTRGALNMGMLDIKSQYVAPIARGNEIAYTLLPLGREYILNVAHEIQHGAAGADASGRREAASAT